MDINSSKKTLLSLINGGILGASAGQTVSFKFADTIAKAITEAAKTADGRLVFAVDATSGAGAIWQDQELVSSRVLDYAIAASASKDHNQQTVTLTYIDKITGLTTKTFDIIDEAGLKAYFTGSKTIQNVEGTYEVKIKTNGGLEVDDNNGLYVDIADLFGVDASTIGFDSQNKLHSLIKMQYHAAVTTEGSEKAAYIALEDVNGNSISEIPVENIIGNGILKSATYNKDTNQLILVFAKADGSEKTVTVDMKDLIDINDIFLTDQAKDYLTITNDTSIATFGVTNKTVTGIALAESAIQGVEKLDVTGAGDYVSLTVAPKTGDASTIQISVDDTAAKNKFVDVDASIDRLDGSVNLINIKDEEQDSSIDRLDSSVSAIEVAIEAMDADLTANALDSSIVITLNETNGKVTSIGVAATEADTTFDSTNISLTSTSGLLTGSAIADIVSYVDAKSGALDSSVTDTDEGGFVTVKVVQENGALTSDTVTVVYGDYSEPQTDGIAKTSTTKAYVDAEIQKLDLAATAANASAADNAGFVKTTISETDGIVKNESVEVTYGDYTNNTNGIAKTADTSVFVENFVASKLTWTVL